MTGISRNSVPLHRILRLRGALLVAGSVMVVGMAFLLFVMRPTVARIAESQFVGAAIQVEASLDRLFAPAVDVLAMSRGWIGDTAPPLENPDAFNRIFQPVLETLPQATSVVAGTSAGEGWLLLQMPGGGWRNRMTDPQRWGNRHLFIERDPDGGLRRYWKTLDYDPRQRSWYLATLRGSRDIEWTAPYAFFTTGDPGITATTRLRLKDGRDFVIGIDLMLRDLSAQTMAARIGTHGMALVLTDDLRVVALPAARPDIAREAWLGNVLKPATALGIAPLNSVLSGWRPELAGQVTSHSIDGTAWLVRIQPYVLGTQRLWVVTLAPEDEFAPPWLPVAGSLLAGLALMLFLVALFARQQARHIARPLEALAAESGRIGQLDFQPAALDTAGIREIGQLADAHNRMRGLLERNQARINSQEVELKRQIVALRAAERAVRDSEAYSKVLFTDSRIALMVLDPEAGRCIDCNQAAVDLYGAPGRQSLLGLTAADVSPPRQPDGKDSQEAAVQMIRIALERGTHVFEWRHRRPDGEEWDAEVHLMAFCHAGRRLLQLSIEDISERKRTALVLEELAFYDTLTGLPNRALFLDRLQQAIGAAQRHGQKVTMMFLDLDRFKEINDTRGHAVGDEVLRAVAHCFRSVLRNEESLARLGGDEFALVAPQADQAAAIFIAERIAGALAKPLEVAGHKFQVGVSIGIALYPDNGETPDALLSNADIAMYRAKTAGRSYMFYDALMSDGMAERVALAQDLKEALQQQDNGLSLHYQPQVDLASGRLLGAEALLRWQHPALGDIPPARFIPIAEERGMMGMLGDWVLAEACRQMAAWRDAGLALPPRLAINVSARQVEDAAFPEQAGDAIRRAGLAPNLFEIELTEGSMMRNVELAIDLLGQLKADGLGVALDDFGTGYSSLAYLRRLPAEKLKIDKSFVSQMLADANDHAIVATIIAMGHGLGLRTVAEGVETEEQAAELRTLGCDSAQGYLFGHPAEAARFAAEWLQPGRTPVKPAG